MDLDNQPTDGHCSSQRQLQTVIKPQRNDFSAIFLLAVQILLCLGVKFCQPLQKHLYTFYATWWAKKRGHRLMTIILSILNRLKKLFYWKIPWRICS